MFKAIALTASAVCLTAVAFYLLLKADPEQSAKLQPESDALAPLRIEPSSVDEAAASSVPDGAVVPTHTSRYPGNAELATDHYQMTDAGPYLPGHIPMRFVKNFTFPDGENISIQYALVERFQEPLQFELDDGVSPGFFEKMKSAALEGDDQAAVHAYHEVKKCAETISPFKDPHGLPHRCSGITHDTAVEALELLRLSAERGSILAQDYYVKEIVQDQPDEARHYFKLLWDNGFVSGVSGLRDTAPPVSELNFNQQVESEAYAYVTYIILMAYYDGVPGEFNEDWVSNMETNERFRQQSLSPAVLEAVQVRAKAMLKSNSKCCVGYVQDGDLLSD